MNCLRCEDTKQVTMCIDEHGMQDVFPCPDCGVEEHPPLRVNPESALALQYTCRILDGMKQSLWLTECAASEDRKDLHVWLIEILKEFRAAAPVAPPQGRRKWNVFNDGKGVWQVIEATDCNRPGEDTVFRGPDAEYRARTYSEFLNNRAAAPRPAEQPAPAQEFRPRFCGGLRCDGKCDQRQCPMKLDNELAEQPSAAAPTLYEALKALYEETADYIRINNLGDVHHNRSMQMARDALAAPAHGGEPQTSPSSAPCVICGKPCNEHGIDSGCAMFVPVAAPSAEAREQALEPLDYAITAQRLLGRIDGCSSHDRMAIGYIKTELSDAESRGYKRGLELAARLHEEMSDACENRFPGFVLDIEFQDKLRAAQREGK